MLCQLYVAFALKMIGPTISRYEFQGIYHIEKDRMTPICMKALPDMIPLM